MASAPLIPVKIRIVPWLLPAWAHAQTWGNLVLVRRGVGLTVGLLAHELAHVLQWRALGMWGFVGRYARYLLRYGYRQNPLEIIARVAQEDEFFRDWARDILASLYKSGHNRQF